MREELWNGKSVSLRDTCQERIASIKAALNGSKKVPMAGSKITPIIHAVYM